MSKIAYKAAATGAGTITLETPVTDVDRTILLPDAGGQMHTSESVNDHASMPTVNGDPIVESGSNSDGEWTRWADGTQHTRQVRSITFSSSTDSTYLVNPLPLAFVDALYAPTFIASQGSSGNRVTDFTVIPLSNNADLRFTAVSSNSDTWTVRVNCFGRWK